MTNDTIYALSTILGKSGVAIIRVSGPSCLQIAKAYGFEDKISHGKLSRHLLTSIVDNAPIDDCLVAYFQGPRSFTGEDILEFHMHGSIAIIKKLLKELASFDKTRVALPGEFSKRAFMNGKMDLSQAEGLSALIESETEVQRQVAARQMLGEQGSLYEGWRGSLIAILARLEALIDFPTDDIPDSALSEASARIHDILDAIRKHLSQDSRSEIIQRGIRVAIVGEPNVGKSTLMNAIAKRDIAITSEIAGTTRDVIEVKLDIAGFPFIFCDTAGVRNSCDIIEKEGVRRSYRAIGDSDLCLMVVDASMQSPDMSLVSYIKDLNKPCFVVYNKIDLVDDFSCDVETSIKLSLVKDVSSVEHLIEYLKAYAMESYTPVSEPLLTSERHRAHLFEATEHLQKFNLDYSIDIASEYVRMAANALGHIVGKIDVEEVLDAIFLKFCIGK